MGELLDALQHLDDEDDINKVLRFFSYEHFYVVYCKFWELDTDHDFMIDKEDLLRWVEVAVCICCCGVGSGGAVVGMLCLSRLGADRLQRPRHRLMCSPQVRQPRADVPDRGPHLCPGPAQVQMQGARQDGVRGLLLVHFLGGGQDHGRGPQLLVQGE